MNITSGGGATDLNFTNAASGLVVGDIVFVVVVVFLFFEIINT